MGTERARLPQPLGPEVVGDRNQWLAVGTCEEQRCSGHGKCVTQGNDVLCECSAGYSGESCQDTKSNHVGLILLVLLIICGTVGAIVVIRKR